MKKKYHIILILILSLWGAVLFSAAEAQLPISQTPSVTDIASASADQSAKTVTGQLTPDPEDFTTPPNPFAAKLTKKYRCRLYRKFNRRLSNARASAFRAA